jgi:hypothetical protein
MEWRCGSVCVVVAALRRHGVVWSRAI